MTITGRLHVIYDETQISEKFRKREFVVEVTENPMYPQYVLFQLTQENCDKLDGIQVANMIEVDFDIRGREWTTPQGEIKYFNTLQAWRLKELAAPRDESVPASPIPEALKEKAAVKFQPDEDELPF